MGAQSSTGQSKYIWQVQHLMALGHRTLKWCWLWPQQILPTGSCSLYNICNLNHGKPQRSLAAIYFHSLRGESRWQALVCMQKKGEKMPSPFEPPSSWTFLPASLGWRLPQRFHLLFLVPLHRDHRQARLLLKLAHIPDNRKSDWALKAQFRLLQDVHVWVHLRLKSTSWESDKLEGNKSFQAQTIKRSRHSHI